MNKDRIYFHHSPNPTIGVEAELYTVSRDSYNLCSGAPNILKYFEKTVHPLRDLQHYSYIDLRIKDQVIVKEKYRKG